MDAKTWMHLVWERETTKVRGLVKGKGLRARVGRAGVRGTEPRNAAQLRVKEGKREIRELPERVVTGPIRIRAKAKG